MSAALHRQSKRASRVILMLSISILDAACRCQSVLSPASVVFNRGSPLSLASSVTTDSYPLSCLTPLLLLALPSYLKAPDGYVFPKSPTYVILHLLSS